MGVKDIWNRIKENKANYNADENKKLNSSLEEAQKDRADESKRLATTSKAVEEKISPAQAANETGEDLEQTQKTITAPNDVTDKAEKAIEEQKAQPKVQKPISKEPNTIPLSQEEFTQAQSEVQSLGIDEGSSDEDVKNALLDHALKNGLIEMQKDGTWRFRQYDSKASSIMRAVGTALSVLLSYLSGGSLPPMNFYNIRSDNDAQAKAQYDEFMNQFRDVMADLYGSDAIAEYQSQNEDKSKKVGEYKTATSGGERTFEQTKELKNIDFNNAQVMAQFQNDLTIALADANADINASMLAREIKSLTEKGYTKQQVAEWVQRMHGQTAANAAADTINKYVGTVGTAVGTAASVSSDKRVKGFTRNYKKYNYVKR